MLDTLVVSIMGVEGLFTRESVHVLFDGSFESFPEQFSADVFPLLVPWSSCMRVLRDCHHSVLSQLHQMAHMPFLPDPLRSIRKVVVVGDWMALFVLNDDLEFIDSCLSRSL